MFTYELTADLQLARSLLVNKQCYRRMANDSAPPPEDLTVLHDETIRYVVAQEEDYNVGLFLLKSLGGYHEVHFCIAPAAWGCSVEIGQGFLEWVWKNTDLHFLLGPVPSYNRLALKLAKRCGFQEFATCPGGTRRGVPFSLILLSITRPCPVRPPS